MAGKKKKKTRASLNQKLICEGHDDNGPVDWAHVVPGKDSDLARVHGGALEPAVLTALQHQEHLALPQLQLVLFAGGVGEHGHIAEKAAQKKNHEHDVKKVVFFIAAVGRKDKHSN